MKILILGMMVLLTACGGGGGGGGAASSETEQVVKVEASSPDTILVGDSRCMHNELIESKLCVSGEGIMHIKSLPTGYKKVILHLGINDMIYFDVTEYQVTSKLDALIAGTDAEVWCVLPSWFNYVVGSEVVQMYRDAMIYSCDHTIDPQIDPYYGDGIHYDAVNYEQVYEYVEGIKKAR